MTAEDSEETTYAEKKVKQAYGMAMGMLMKSAGLLESARGSLGNWGTKTMDQLSLLETQLKVLYQESLWMIHQNYVLALQVMNQYVIFARAFYDTYAIASHEKKELTYSSYVEQVKALSIIAGMPYNDEDIARAQEYFNEAKNLWEDRLLSMDNKSQASKELLEVLKKALALQLGKFNRAIGLGFYDIYKQLIQTNPDVTLDEFIDECRKIFASQWKDEYFMRRLASEYYVFNKWRIEELNNDYLARYAAEHTRLSNLRRLVEHSLNLAAEKYLQLYEYLITIYYDEEVGKYTGKKGEEIKIGEIESKIERLKLLNAKAMEIFGYYGNEVKNFVQESKVYQFATKTLHLNVPLDYARTNVLRLFKLTGLVVKKFNEGMTVIFDKATNTVTVLIDTVKNPGELKATLCNQYKNLKSVAKGYYLMLDFDADGWVSMADCWNSMGLLYKQLKEMNYVGEAKAIYARALGYMILGKREVCSQVNQVIEKKSEPQAVSEIVSEEHPKQE